MLCVKKENKNVDNKIKKHNNNKTVGYIDK